jgi:hypothetical protein
MIVQLDCLISLFEEFIDLKTNISVVFQVLFYMYNSIGTNKLYLRLYHARAFHSNQSEYTSYSRLE